MISYIAIEDCAYVLGRDGHPHLAQTVRDAAKEIQRLRAQLINSQNRGDRLARIIRKQNVGLYEEYIKRVEAEEQLKYANQVMGSTS